jgi:hypothetical protein
LGDARWLMNLHDAEAEEDRIAEGISQKEDPEAILPDPEPGVDFLATLMGMWTADNSDSAPGALSAGLAGMSPTETAPIAPNASTAPLTSEPLRLFASDLDFAKEAFQELLDNQPVGLTKEAALTAPEWEDHIAGFTLKAPLDLRERYRFLPPELQQNADWTFKLTTDRALVQKALEKSRQDADAWPEFELFWEQHPVAECSGVTKRRCSWRTADWKRVNARSCSKACSRINAVNRCSPSGSRWSSPAAAATGSKISSRS